MTRTIEAAWAAIDRSRLRQLLLEMVDIYSPSGKEEDIQLFLEAFLRRQGVAVERQVVEEERYNLHAVLGDRRPDLYLVGHTDTVAAWDLEDFGAKEAGDILRGLGSADMKGGCAAMIEAFIVLSRLPAGERPPLGLLLVVGEEETGDGSAAFLRQYQPAWAIIGEPTGLAACFSHFGYLEATFTTRGRRIHSSLPELGHNAVESMLRVLLHIGRTPLFDRQKSEIVYSVREMNSANAGFVVPDRCESRIDLHLPPGTEPETVAAAIRRSAAGAAEFVPDLDLEIDFAFAAAGYDLGTGNRPAQLLPDIYRDLELPLRLEPFRSHSDGNLFYQAGVRPLILGPGSLEVAHTAGELTDLAGVLAAAKIYAALALEFSR